MKNKERLLSFDEPTRFIFSHSALREGWDNPNVFQICTLKHSDSTTMKRQEVGRGLRLCVNQDGHRMDEQSLGRSLVNKVNKLTVIASESYKEFVTELQKQIKENLYERPTKASKDYFKGKTIRVNGEAFRVTESQATAIYIYLAKNDYIDKDEHISDKYHADLDNGVLAALPEDLKPMEDGIHKLIQSIFDDKAFEDMFDDGNDTKIPSNELNDNFYKQEFQKLWGYINHKYAYTVEFDSNELIRKAIEHIDKELYVSMLQYTVSSSEQKDILSAQMIRESSSFMGAKSKTTALKHFETSQVKYDLIGKIAEGTKLTRKTVAAILQGITPAKFGMFRNNPEEFITKVIRLINEQKATMIVDHISYDQIEGKYDNEIFTVEKHVNVD